MPKQNRHPRSLAPSPESPNHCNAPDQDLSLFARSFHVAAKKLAEALELDSSPFTDSAACCPVVFMYRYALELHLKSIVLGEGGNFLATKLDPLSIYKTYSVASLRQLIAEIVAALNRGPNSRGLERQP
jgi:hypothetical protein